LLVADWQLLLISTQRKDAVIIQKCWNLFGIFYFFNLIKLLVLPETKQPILRLYFLVLENFRLYLSRFYLNTNPIYRYVLSDLFLATTHQLHHFTPFEQFRHKFIRIPILDLAFHTDISQTIFAFFVGKNVVIVEVIFATLRALKWQYVIFKLMSSFMRANEPLNSFGHVILDGFCFFYFWKYFASGLKIVPNIAHLRNRAEDWPLHLINKMAKLIRTLNELSFGLVYNLKLNLAYNFLIEFDVDQDIVSAFFESVFNSDNFNFFRIVVTDM